MDANVSRINWKKVYKFSPGEFPEDPNQFAEPKLIYSLDEARMMHDRRIYPSPVKGALARFDPLGKKSQHYVDLERGRLSKAVDFFPTGMAISMYHVLMAGGKFQGIGIYLDSTGPDGEPWVMFHADIREVGFRQHVPLLWFAEKDEKDEWKYRYPQMDPQYWELFQDKRLYEERRFLSQ